MLVTDGAKIFCYDLGGQHGTLRKAERLAAKTFVEVRRPLPHRIQEKVPRNVSPLLSTGLET